MGSRRDKDHVKIVRAMLVDARIVEATLVERRP
jgi:hypothetical protein